MLVYTHFNTTDGFGAQYQKIVSTYIYCKLKGLIYKYTPFTQIEHNYNNDPLFIEKKEKFINLYNNIPLVTNEDNIVNIIPYREVLIWLSSLENLNKACASEHMDFIKKCFWQNKDRDVYKNNKKNIAIHIRRENSHDLGQAGERITTPDAYYLSIIEIIRKKYNNTNLHFHIYSQGNIENFKIYEANDTIMHINEEIEKTFVELVGADILVTSPSSFSYVAALLSDGEIYYKNFWCIPRSSWIICG